MMLPFRKKGALWLESGGVLIAPTRLTQLYTICGVLAVLV